MVCLGDVTLAQCLDVCLQGKRTQLLARGVSRRAVGRERPGLCVSELSAAAQRQTVPEPLFQPALSRDGVVTQL